MAGIDDRIEQSKNWLERLAEKIPGYRGYKQKELSRQADKTERVYVAEYLDTCLVSLDDLKLGLMRAKKLEVLDEVDAVMRKLRQVRDRVQFADYGYAGLFDSAKVDQGVLEQLRAFDQSLEADAGGIRDMVRLLAADSPSLEGDVRLLSERVQALDARFDERENIITGAGR